MPHPLSHLRAKMSVLLEFRVGIICNTPNLNCEVKEFLWGY